MNLPEFHALFFSCLPSNSIPISSSSSFHLSFPFFLRCMMWMLGYNYDDAARKLRPLLPRPSAFPDHFLGFVEQDKRDNIVATSQQVVVSSRWNPTPEQLQTLEELYRRGTRTPSADQIQQITSQLRRYGKIEGKNVFYWFQNHKARERQKRRRQLSDHQQHDETEKRLEKSTEAPTTGNEGSIRAAYGVEEAKKDWASPTKCTTISVKTTQGATKGAERKSDGWVELDIDAHEIVSHNKQSRNATWQVHKRPHDNFINIVDLEPYLINPHHHEEDGQTLQLFPVESVHEEERSPEEERECASMSGGASDPVTTPYRFFEFLPLKNQ